MFALLQRRLAGELLAKAAKGNGVVVKQLLAEQGIDAKLRTCSGR